MVIKKEAMHNESITCMMYKALEWKRREAKHSHAQHGN